MHAKACICFWIRIKYKFRTYSREIDSWFSNFLGVSCRFVRLPDLFTRNSKLRNDVNNSLSLANEGQFLMVTTSSVEYVSSFLTEREKSLAIIEHFRPNLVVDTGIAPFKEESFSQIKVGDYNFLVC